MDLHISHGLNTSFRISNDYTVIKRLVTIDPKCGNCHNAWFLCGKHIRKWRELRGLYLMRTQCLYNCSIIGCKKELYFHAHLFLKIQSERLNSIFGLRRIVTAVHANLQYFRNTVGVKITSVAASAEEG